MQKIQRNLQNELLKWFCKHKRALPWRKKQDPYSIWISEVMLQQTTSKAVIPYYIKFLKKFPDVKKLSGATEREVFSLWAGLGYYSRAKNLMKASLEIHKKGFPKTYKELIKLPGFGDYTARAVSSLAFKEPVGVLDGNIVRFLSRFYAKPFKYWETKDKKQMQTLSDLWVQNQNPKEMNQALMELGALICTSGKPACLLCPVSKGCKAFKTKTQDKFPIKKAKRKSEIWYWKAQVAQKQNKWAFTKNEQMPFLKGKLVFPGKIKQLKDKPKNYDFEHSITHHKIFVSLQKSKRLNGEKVKWLSSKQIKEQNPSSLIKKVLLRV